jgi:hypothetical protein
MKHKPRGYWTKERCHEIALTCKTRKEFGVKYSSVYQYARKYGWLDEICSHMSLRHKPNGYWTKERCHEEALKFNSRWEFEKGCGRAYEISRRNGWLNDISSHMKQPNPNNKPYGYWTKERCHEIALTCKTRKEFGVKYNRPYRNARINGWLDEICSHMSLRYKPNGYWTKERCHEEALKYKSRKEFQSKCSGGYGVSFKNGWLDEICTHMIPKTRPMRYWNDFENHKNAAKNCKNIFEYCVTYSGAYKIAFKNGWLHQLFPNSVVKKRRK